MKGFYILDGYFAPRAYIKAFNIQWRRRYYSFGDFELTMPATDYKARHMKYVYHIDNNEVAIINKVDYISKGAEKYVSLSGYFYEYTLCDGAYLYHTGKYGYPNIGIRDLCMYNVRDWIEEMNGIHYRDYDDLKYPILVDPESSVGKDITEKLDGDIERYAELGTSLYDVLKTAEASQRLVFNPHQRLAFNPRDGYFNYEVFRGANKTSTCIFSDVLDNISDFEYVEDDSNYKNIIRLFYQDDNHDIEIFHTIKDIWNTGTERYKWMNYTVESIEDVENKTRAQIENDMRTQGTFELLNHKKIKNLKFNLVPGKYEYKKDFDIGDKITVTLKALEITAEYRIIEIREIYKNNTLELQLIVGDEKIKQFKKGW